MDKAATVRDSLNVKLLMGPVLVGLFLSTSLYSVVCVMAFQYFKGFPEDPLYYRISVAVVWMFDTVHVLCGIQLMWYWLIQHYGDVTHLMVIPPSYSIIILLTMLSGTITHLNIIIKVWTLSDHKKITALPLLLLMVTTSVMAISTSIDMLKAPTFLVGHAPWSIIGGLASGALSDIGLCGMLSYFLLRSRSGFSASRVDPIVNRMTQYLVGTGSLSAVGALLTLVLYLTRQKSSLVHTGVYVLLERFYVLLQPNAHSSLGISTISTDSRLPSHSRTLGIAFKEGTVITNELITQRSADDLKSPRFDHIESIADSPNSHPKISVRDDWT
ncbi:hypothetical protein BD410DRAFT_589659 [Rickenella mellea]|uniref:DUF6534 domain-containing protein n=1 Tax=Rickenella mellea TaxID=50990 RepID=A0A4Y7PN57_9AGAM|nr:hypothetical protein BD410DRAFT_589659 [Rickenella mellea]